MTAYVDRVVGATCYRVIRVADCSPIAISSLMSLMGLMAAMVEDGMWKLKKKPVDEFVVIAVESVANGHAGIWKKDEVEDQATYQLSEATFDQGRIEYQRALGKLAEVARAGGWMGWKEAGVMQL